MLLYQAALPLSSRTLNFTARLIRTDRLAADRPFYQGKHRCHGMNLQAIADPDGNLLWISGAIRGSVHDTLPAITSRAVANPPRTSLRPAMRITTPFISLFEAILTARSTGVEPREADSLLQAGVRFP